MLGTIANIEAVAQRLAVHMPAYVVLDPVMRASSGNSLATEELAAALIHHLAPLTTLVTPNLAEAAKLAGVPLPASVQEMSAAGAKLGGAGFEAVLVKGGHLAGADPIDVLCEATGYRIFPAPRIATQNTHGTGCTLSSAIAAGLAHGLPLASAVENAKAYVSASLAGADRLNVGHGAGPLHHFSGLSACLAECAACDAALREIVSTRITNRIQMQMT